MRQRIFAFLLVLLVLSPSAIRAQEEYTSTVYIHPITLILGTAVEILPVMLYVTYEKQLSNPQNALIVTPYVSFMDLDLSGDHLKSTEMQIGFGLRHYLSSEMGNAGYFLQAKAHLGYASMSVDYSDSFYDDEDGSGVAGSLVFYWGSKKQFDRIAIFSDIGLGYQFSSISFSNLDYSATGLAIDLDFGIGFGF